MNVFKRLFHTSNPRRTCREVHDGVNPSGRFICLFASFDHKSRIPAYVLAYLDELRLQCCDIVFISTAPELKSDALNALKPLCTKIVLRENRGLDFASWQAGEGQVENLNEYQGVLLANDSVLGPLVSLDRVFSVIDSSKECVVGLNDSYELGYHLQSFFLYFPMQIFASPTFKRFWQSIKVLKDKQKIIDRYELGLSRFLQENGIPFRAAFPYSELRAKADEIGQSFEFKDRLVNNLPINPSLHFWKILLDEFNYPFIKRELLTRNPVGAKGVESYRDELRNSDLPIKQMISSYLLDDPV